MKRQSIKIQKKKPATKEEVVKVQEMILAIRYTPEAMEQTKEILAQ